MSTACRCYRKPCPPHKHNLAFDPVLCHTHIHEPLIKDSSLTGPACNFCGNPTRRAGVCWLCVFCGNTTSC